MMQISSQWKEEYRILIAISIFDFMKWSKTKKGEVKYDIFKMWHTN